MPFVDQFIYRNSYRLRQVGNESSCTLGVGVLGYICLGTYASIANDSHSALLFR